MTAEPALNVLLSLTAADALGAATEFMTPDAIARTFPRGVRTYQPGSPFGFAPGEATDDSQMTVASLIGYARGREGVLPALLDWLGTRPPDVGGLTRAALTFGTPDGGYRAWVASGRQSAGNGGLMRVAAPFIAGFRGESLLDEAARVTALTHADPRCVLASVAFVALLEALERREPLEAAARDALERLQAFDAAAVVLRLQPSERDEDARAYRAEVPSARAAVGEALRAGVAGEVGSQSGYVLHTLQAATAHARAEDWLACIEPAVLGGDDSDTVACVAGAIAGARGLTVPEALRPDLRLGHSWPGWDRAWTCEDRYPQLVRAASGGAHR